jgi:hypothetical protein
MNNNFEAFLVYLRSKYETEKDEKCKNLLKENIIVFESFTKEKTLEEHTLSYVGITALVKRELLDFFQISFVHKNHLSSMSLTFSDERLEHLIEKIYRHVIKGE